MCASPDEMERVRSQLKQIIRPMYSNPPAHGARVVARVLSDPQLQQQWHENVVTMANRIHEMRTLLFDELKRIQCPGDWSHIVKQIGMFTFTGLTRTTTTTTAAATSVEECGAICRKTDYYRCYHLLCCLLQRLRSSG